jgi:hypothetical protein
MSLHPAVMQLLTKFLADNPFADFYKGKLLIVEPHRIRIRIRS